MVLFAMSACTFAGGCTLLSIQEATLLFVQRDADCATTDDIEGAEVSAGQGRVEIDGLLRVGTPCRHLIPTLKTTRSSIVLSVDALLQPGPCPFCLGKIEYTAVIGDLKPGAYTVRVRHGDRTIECAAVVVTTPP